MSIDRRPGRLLLFFLVSLCGISLSVRAQEFPRGFVGYLEGHQGLSTGFTGTPDLYFGGLQFRPQYTVVANLLRLGATAGLLYSDTHLDGVLGPSLALKICTFSVEPFGSIANLQVQADYWWSSRSRGYLGFGPKIEMGQLLMIGVTAHRDFQDNAWIFQTTTGFNLFHKKRKSVPPVDPLHPH